MKVLGPPKGYAYLLDEGTTKRLQEKKDVKGYHPLRPSNLGECSRSLYYDFLVYLGRMKVEGEVKKPNVHRLLNLGNVIERHVFGEFKDNVEGVSQKYGQQVVEFYQLHSKNDPSLAHLVEGSLDKCFLVEDYKGVIDIKSKKDKFSQAYKTDWDDTTSALIKSGAIQVSDTGFWIEDLEEFLYHLPDPFLAENFIQLNGYACTPFLVKRGYNHGSIFQYNKNDSRVRDIMFKPSRNLFEEGRQKFQAILDAVDESQIELAPKEYTLGSMKCAYCPYSKLCWGDTSNALKQHYREYYPKTDWPVELYKVAEGETLENLFKEYESHLDQEPIKEKLEEDIIHILEKHKIKRIKLNNGNIYELKILKSPKERFVLRRGKL